MARPKQKTMKKKSLNEVVKNYQEMTRLEHICGSHGWIPSEWETRAKPYKGSKNRWRNVEVLTQVRCAKCLKEKTIEA